MDYRKMSYPKLCKIWDKGRYAQEHKTLIKELISRQETIQAFSIDNYKNKANRLAIKKFGDPTIPQGTSKMQPRHLAAIYLAMGGGRSIWKHETKYFLEFLFNTSTLCGVTIQGLMWVVYDFTTHSTEIWEVYKFNESYSVKGIALKVSLPFPNSKQLFQKIAAYSLIFKNKIDAHFEVLLHVSRFSISMENSIISMKTHLLAIDYPKGVSNLARTFGERKKTALLWYYAILLTLDINEMVKEGRFDLMLIRRQQRVDVKLKRWQKIYLKK